MARITRMKRHFKPLDWKSFSFPVFGVFRGSKRSFKVYDLGRQAESNCPVFHPARPISIHSPNPRNQQAWCHCRRRDGVVFELHQPGDLMSDCRNKRPIRWLFGRLALFLARYGPLRGCSSLAPHAIDCSCALKGFRNSSTWSN